MSITWGGYVNHLRIGIDVWTSSYNSGTTSVNVYVAVYVQCDPSWNFNDSQTATLSGSRSASWTFQNTLGANQSIQVGTTTIANQGLSYAGGPTYNFTAVLSGVYLGAGPSVSRSFTLPPRPIRPTSAPGKPTFSQIGDTHVLAGWLAPTDTGGSNPDTYELQVSANSAFTAMVYDANGAGTARTVINLAPGVSYWSRVRAHNGAGWSGWSGTGSVTTAIYPSAPTVAPGPDTATLSWSAPAAGSNVSGFQAQVSYGPGGAGNVALAPVAGGATSFTATGLTPGTTYYARVRAMTSTGYGAWSGDTLFQTLSGAKVMTGGQFQNAVAYVQLDGAWVPAKVHKRVNAAWVL